MEGLSPLKSKELIALNLKAIAKAIKTEGNGGTLYWQLKDGTHYITNRRWAVRFEHEIPEDLVLKTLLPMYRRLPLEGETLTFRFQGAEAFGPDISKVYNTYAGRSLTQGHVTAFLRDNAGTFGRIILFGKHVQMIDNTYADMIVTPSGAKANEQVTLAGQPAEIEGNGSSAVPLYFCNRNLLILPFRIKDHMKNDIKQMLVVAGE